MSNKRKAERLDEMRRGIVARDAALKQNYAELADEAFRKHQVAPPPPPPGWHYASIDDEGRFGPLVRDRGPAARREAGSEDMSLAKGALIVAAAFVGLLVVIGLSMGIGAWVGPTALGLVLLTWLGLTVRSHGGARNWLAFTFRKRQP